MMRVTAIAWGRVQGVGYRSYVTDCAREAGVKGFVRNEPDGSVLVVAEGSRESLDRFVRLVRADEDPIIRVDRLEVGEERPTGEFTGFGIRW